MTKVTKEMGIEDLRGLLAPFDSIEHVHFDPASGDARFIQDPDSGRVRFALQDRQMPLSGQAYFRLGSLVGVPEAFLKKTPPALTLPSVNFWLANSGAKELSFTVDQGAVANFAKGEDDPIPNTRVLDKITEIFGPELNVYHVSHNRDHTAFSLTTREEHEVQLRDVVRAGITVENSMANLAPLTLSAYQQRLVCTNGMISTETVYRAAKRHGGDGFEEWLASAVRGVQEHLAYEVALSQDMASRELDGHISDHLASIYAEFSVPRSAQEGITARILDRQPRNLWELTNAFTDVASNDSETLEDPQLSLRLMRVGGQIASHQETCGSCHRILVH